MQVREIMIKILSKRSLFRIGVFFIISFFLLSVFPSYLVNDLQKQESIFRDTVIVDVYTHLIINDLISCHKKIAAKRKELWSKKKGGIEAILSFNKGLHTWWSIVGIYLRTGNSKASEYIDMKMREHRVNQNPKAFNKIEYDYLEEKKRRNYIDQFTR